MRQFTAFVKKEFCHVFRDVRTVLILVVMPIVQIILFGFAISTEVQNVNVAILAPEMGSRTGRLIERLDVNRYFTVTGLLSDDSEIEKAFRKGADMVLALSSDFEAGVFSDPDASLQIVSDATNTNISTAATGYATSIIQDFLMEEAGMDMSGNGVVPSVKMLYNPQMKSSYSFVPGVMGMIIILICAMMTSISIVREKETGTMELLLVSPMKPHVIILSKMVPYLTLSIVNYVTILLLSTFLLDIPIAGSIWTLTLLSVIYIIVSLSLGLLISTMMETQVAAMLASGMVLMMPVMFFSGLMFPVESMPVFFQWLSDIIPAKWYISGVKKIMIEGLPFVNVIMEFSILLGMAAFLMAVSLKQFKFRLK